MIKFIPTMVYKVCSTADWQQAKQIGSFDGSPHDRRDGFIHLSTYEQLAGTLAKHYSSADGRALPGMVLVAFDTASLGPSLKWEAARDGALFPHLYAPLQTRLAISEAVLDVDAEGRHVLTGEHGHAGGLGRC
ncbi:MAG: DUF952 domain-containing protein [Hyphomicrobiaceae bacterium]